jgi:cytochrome c peroxidase
MRPIWMLLAGLSLVSTSGVADDTSLPNVLHFPNPTGYAATFSTTGTVDLTGPFFQSLGTNGRSCGSCHQPSDGWTITPEHLQQRFDATDGTDPVFRPVDGANAPELDVSTTEARRSAYSMLLTKGLIRVGIAIPAGAQFELVAVDDPYGHASAQDLSLFRRPLPSTNLRFLSAVMWDGRETFKDATSKDCVIGSSNCFSTIHFDLADQSNTATINHAQGATSLTDEQREAIVAFETTLFTAQVYDSRTGPLGAQGALGGPDYLSAQNFYFGVNDAIAGDYQTHGPFNAVVFRAYDAWSQLHAAGGGTGQHDRRMVARRQVANGQMLFNTRPIHITGVKGLNDDLGIPEIVGTCTTCHDAPNVGDHSIPAPLDIGLTDASRRTPDLPLYTLRNLQTNETIQTTDPGRALVTGKWTDVGRFKGPILRGVAARAPYFHNGFAADLSAVIDFYNTRFNLNLADQEKADLIAFLQSL